MSSGRGLATVCWVNFSRQGRFPMAAGSLLTLLDDIAAVLDDVALMTRVAATSP
jgi:hypothetical protein